MKNRILNILVFVFILIIAVGLIFEKELGDLDEIWQYNFANNIVNGLTPYKDFNIIVTPLFSNVAAIFLKVLSNQLFVMRIFDTMIFTLDIYMAYKIFRILSIDRSKSVLFTIIMYLLFIYNLGVEYNYMVLLIVLISLYIEIKNTKSYGALFLKNDILLSALIGCTIVTKQTIGIIMSIMYIFYKISFIKNKEDIKIVKKIVINRIIGVMIPVVILFIYLIINDAINEFINYTILGLTDFKNKESYLKLFKEQNINFLIKVFSFIVPIILTYIIRLLKQNNKKEIEITLFTYAIFMMFGLFPIVGNGHFIIYAFVGVIATMYFLYIIIKKILNGKENNYVKQLISMFVVLFAVNYSICNIQKIFILYNNSNICKNKDTHYENIIISKHILENIEEVDNYIKNCKEDNIDVYILDYQAAIYMIPLNKYTKDYDMLMKGNLGYKGEEKIIKRIEQSKNVKYLVLDDKYESNWQTPVNIINYVKENKNKVGDIYIFNIYE